MSVALAVGLVGLSIGLVGIGGIFLIPLLVANGMPLEEAIGTSLFAFTFTGIVATAIYAKHGSIDWHAVVLTSAGSLVGGPAGAKLSVWLPGSVVSAIFAIFLLVTGVTTLRNRSATAGDVVPRAATPRRIGTLGLLACGLAVGVGSGLTGVGGPAILVPLLLFLRFPPSVAVGISQPNAIAASASGAIGHLVFGRIDVPLGVMLSVLAGSGVIAGALLHQRVGVGMLRRLVSTACVLLGLWIIGQLVRGWLEGS